MRLIELSAGPDVAPPPPARPVSGPRASTYVRVALACLLLAGSGAVRRWQAAQVSAVLREARNCPFPLAELPMTLGSWRGEATQLDPKIARNTGATDIITRRYVDQHTGATLEAIVLYGPSTEVYGHVPELCYPTAGYEAVEAAEPRAIRAGALEAPFRSLVYSKGEGGQADRQEVYYSWRYNDRWSPEVVRTFKKLERVPGMLKVQLARRVSERERRDVGNPCEALLAVLLPELERRLAEAPAPGRPPEGPSR